MELSPETLLHNRYRIINKLGQGGMGAVYLAYDTALEHEVAVKLNRNPSPESTDQFLKEAQLLATLKHPNLPRVIDYFIIDQNQFLVMDYITGDNLGELLEKVGAQSIEQVLIWTQKVGSALIYLHRQTPPVIHRDIKPANLKLTPQRDVILVDFGIAKAVDSSQATAIGALGYTPGYAPPEQYSSARTGPYSDQYALAATIYNLITGQTPVDSVQRALEQAVLTPMNLLQSNIPDYVQSAIEKAMSIRPKDRFKSIEGFIRALTDPTYQPTLRKQRKQTLTSTKPAKYLHTQSHSFNWIWGLVIAAVILTIVVSGTGLGYLLIRRQVAPTPQGNTPLSQELQETAIFPTRHPTFLPTSASTQPISALIVPTKPIATATFEPSPTPPPKILGGGGVIAFVSDRTGNNTFQIWTMQVALDNLGQIITSDVNQITLDPEDKQYPHWSPDGKKLLYSAPGINEDLGLDIWMLDLSTDNSQPINLTLLKGNDTDPAWSPDGEYIAFTNQNRWTDTLQIFVMRNDGSDQRRISGDYFEYAPCWSHDMSWLLNVIYASSHRYFHVRPWVESTYPTPFPTSRPYDRNQFFGRQGEVSDPAWSLNGGQIAYTRLVDKNRQIYSLEYKSGGGKTNLLTSDAFQEYEPAWSPDSQWIVFTSERDKNQEIYIMTSAGLMQTNLTKHASNDKQPAWQP